MYIYNDEDNAPMNDDPFMGTHNPTIYTSRSEMKAMEEALPFTDPEEPPRCCGTCMEYNGSYCMKYWNNLDECYKDKDRDSKDPEDYCEDYEYDETNDS